MSGIACNGFCYGMRTVAFGGSDGLYQFFFGYAGARMAGLHLECALGQRTCLVEYHRIDSGYGIQVVPSFEQYAQAGCSADASEVSQRNTYHQSART
ncbi:unknown [Bacteroides eggerthii CAG:109]|nr:unknown [Bacteroides eggerthii CAG:109]